MAIQPKTHAQNLNRQASIYGSGQASDAAFKNLKLKSDAKFSTSSITDFKQVRGEIVSDSFNSEEEKIKNSAYRNHLYARINNSRDSLEKKKKRAKNKVAQEKVFQEEWVNKGAEKIDRANLVKRSELNSPEELANRVSQLENKIRNLENIIHVNQQSVKADFDLKYQKHTRDYSSMLKDLSNLTNHVSFA